MITVQRNPETVKSSNAVKMNQESNKVVMGK